MIDIIYKRDNFLKKILEDSSSCEESLRLLRFLIWENPDVTSTIFNEIVGLVSQFFTLFCFQSRSFCLAFSLLYM
jgi:ubiquitin carboxyl-terminal hydrolase 9/24